VWSLGGRASLRIRANHRYYNPDWDEWRDAKTAYIVHIQVPDKTKLFKLQRKKEKADVPFQGGRATLKRKIVSIEPAGRGEAVCIKVDHPNGLFLTDGFVVTHNSDLLLGLALTAHKKSILFRREFPQLRELVDRSAEILKGTNAKYTQTFTRWTSIPGGRRLEFGAVQHEKDREKYKGRPHDLKAFDEIPDFLEDQFRFLIAWNRSTDPNQRCRVVCAGNPPTHAAGAWVIRYWAPWLSEDHTNPAQPGELRYFATLDGKDVEVPNKLPFKYNNELIRPLSRTFIPSRIKDNPYLRDTGYEAVLQGLPEPLRSQLLFGDFMQRMPDRPQQVIPTEWVKAAQRRWKDRSEPSGPITSMGIDPSRGGADVTELARKKENYFMPLLSYPGAGVPDGPACATLVVAALEEDLDAILNIDIIGIGSSVYDILAALDLEVVAINFSSKSDERDKSGLLGFRNLRAEAYWKLREDLDPLSGKDLALPPGDEVIADLVAPTWSTSIRGILIESKKDIRKRLKRSPGKGDAIVLANYEPVEGVYFA
jgi:hypothetical protein